MDRWGPGAPRSFPPSRAGGRAPAQPSRERGARGTAGGGAYLDAVDDEGVAAEHPLQRPGLGVKCARARVPAAGEHCGHTRHCTSGRQPSASPEGAGRAGHLDPPLGPRPPLEGGRGSSGEQGKPLDRRGQHLHSDYTTESGRLLGAGGALCGLQLALQDRGCSTSFLGLQSSRTALPGPSILLSTTWAQVPTQAGWWKPLVFPQLKPDSEGTSPPPPPGRPTGARASRKAPPLGHERGAPSRAQTRRGSPENPSPTPCGGKPGLLREPSASAQALGSLESPAGLVSISLMGSPGRLI